MLEPPTLLLVIITVTCSCCMCTGVRLCANHFLQALTKDMEKQLLKVITKH
jgi:hypothetical protein